MQIIEYLFKQGAKIDGGFPYHYIDVSLKNFMTRGDFSLLRLLLQNGLKIDEDYDFLGFSFGKHSLLQHAALTHDVNLLKFLLECGADPNKKGLFNKSPLRIASEFGNREMIELLLKYGAKP